MEKEEKAKPKKNALNTLKRFIKEGASKEEAERIMGEMESELDATRQRIKEEGVYSQPNGACQKSTGQRPRRAWWNLKH